MEMKKTQTILILKLRIAFYLHLKIKTESERSKNMSNQSLLAKLSLHIESVHEDSAPCPDCVPTAISA